MSPCLVLRKQMNPWHNGEEVSATAQMLTLVQCLLLRKSICYYSAMMTEPNQHNPQFCSTPDKTANVLVLDDDKSLRDVVERVLTRAGFHVMTAREGSEGLQVLLSNRFDVVVSDLMMEPMDGITFLKEALKIWPWMGAIVFSGYMQEKLLKEAKALGVRHILEKPMAFNKLAECVADEAARVRNNIGGSGALTLSRVLYQLNMLRDNTTTAIESDNMEQALLNLCRDLGGSMPSILTAIVYQTQTDEKPIYAANLRQEVSTAYFSQLEKMIRERYSRLGGTLLDDTANWNIGGKSIKKNAKSPTAEALSFPIISGNQINGILIFLPPDDFHCTESDISFLYHAVNHFTTLLIAFHRIRELAVRDELTGLYNRHHLREELPSVWDIAMRYGLNPAILIIDVDHFKLINDNYGHATGDEAMRTLADIVRQTCRSSDLIARYGGDEIIVILRDAEPASLGRLAKRIQVSIGEYVFCPDTHAFRFTVSIGAASCRKEDGSLISSEELLNHADEALYTAKRNGRNRAIVWSQPDNQNAGNTNTEHDPPVRTNQPTIMVVDDDPSVLKITKILLQAEHIDVQTFEQASSALQAFDSNPMHYDCALIDLNLDDMNGLELVRRMSEKNPALVSIIITGDATLDNAVSSLRHGAYDFIQKPVQRNQLKITLDRALEYHRLRLENEAYQQNLESMVKRKSLELTNALKRTRDAFDFTLRTMTGMLDAREHNTGAHSIRVQELTVFLLKHYKFTQTEIDGIRQGALLHDIGKIAVPDDILLKEGSLTTEEWKIMREHVNIGFNLIQANPDLKIAADIILYHHERYDGSGYPHGRKGEEIPLGTRIFSLVDAYDAMRSMRPYRSGLSREMAIEQIMQNSGTQFDPEIVKVFLQNIDAIEAIGKWS